MAGREPLYCVDHGDGDMAGDHDHGVAGAVYQLLSL